MKTVKITEAEIADKRVSSLPTRPTVPAAFGGKGYTAAELKAAFDALPLFIVERLNSLIDEISAEGGIATAIKTGIEEAATLDLLLLDIKNGNLADYLTLSDGSTLTETLDSLRTDIDRMLSVLSD